MQTLAAGRGLLESPRWHGGRLWFADWIAGEILACEVEGEVSGANCDVVVRHESLPLCFDFLPDGALVMVSAPENALIRVDTEGNRSTYANLALLSPYPSNDIVVDGRGNAYVNNGNFDFAAGPPPGPTAPGFVSLAREDGTLVQVADDLAFPNGMAVSPDGGTLIVAESYRNRLAAFDIAADGTLSGRRVWADLGDGVPDGICIDAAGAVWYADVPNRRCVRVREGGEVLQTVDIDRGAFACMLGGADESTLFVVAAHWHGMQALGGDVTWDGQLLSTPAPAPGAGFPARS